MDSSFPGDDKNGHRSGVRRNDCKSLFLFESVNRKISVVEGEYLGNLQDVGKCH